jgi:hypothetical protein
MAAFKINPRGQVQIPGDGNAPRMSAAPTRALGGYRAETNISTTSQDMLASALGHLAPSLNAARSAAMNVFDRQAEDQFKAASAAGANVSDPKEAKKLLKEYERSRASYDGFLSASGKAAGIKLSMEIQDKMESNPNFTPEFAQQYAKQQMEGWDLQDTQFMAQAAPEVANGLMQGEGRFLARQREVAKKELVQNVTLALNQAAKNAGKDPGAYLEAVRQQKDILKPHGLHTETARLAWNALMSEAYAQRDVDILEAAKMPRSNGTPPIIDTLEGAAGDYAKAVQDIESLRQHDVDKAEKQRMQMNKDVVNNIILTEAPENNTAAQWRARASMVQQRRDPAVVDLDADSLDRLVRYYEGRAADLESGDDRTRIEGERHKKATLERMYVSATKTGKVPSQGAVASLIESNDLGAEAINVFDGLRKDAGGVGRAEVLATVESTIEGFTKEPNGNYKEISWINEAGVRQTGAFPDSETRALLFKAGAIYDKRIEQEGVDPTDNRRMKLIAEESAQQALSSVFPGLTAKQAGRPLDVVSGKANADTWEADAAAGNPLSPEVIRANKPGIKKLMVEGKITQIRPWINSHESPEARRLLLEIDEEIVVDQVKAQRRKDADARERHAEVDWNKVIIEATPPPFGTRAYEALRSLVTGY